MANLTLLLAAKVWETGLWGTIISWFSPIGNYGWIIILFTICLKLVMTPFDFMQKSTTNKNQEVQKKMQPELQKLQAKFGNNREALQQKQLEIYKKYNYNVVGSCFMMLLNLAIPMIIFFTLFASLNDIAAIKIYNQYDGLKEQYTISYDLKTTEGASEEDATEYARQVVLNHYETEAKESWLWISNVWKGDKATSIVPTYDEYKTYSAKAMTAEETEYINSLSEEERTAFYATEQAEYEKVMFSISAEETGWNGYYILMVVAGLTSYLSALFMQKSNKPKNVVKNSNEPDPTAGMSKIMMYVLPIIMVIFTLTSNAIFSLYIIVSSLFSMATQPIFNVIFKAIEKRKAEKNEVIVEYSRDQLNK